MMPRYNIGDVLTFRGVIAWDRRLDKSTKRWREVVVTKSGNFLSNIAIYPELKDTGPYRTVVKMPKKLRIREHKKSPNTSPSD
jgi:hypothetical protein